MAICELADRLTHEGINVRYDEPMALHTSFRAGGHAALAVFPKDIDELCLSFKLSDEYSELFPTYLLGFGSNTLFCDGRYNGVVIITKNIREVSFPDNIDLLNIGDKVRIVVECGASLTLLAKSCSDLSLAGLEFAYGIPGSIGGAVVMNAGAYGGEMKDIVFSTLCYDRKSGEKINFVLDEHKFNYRKSIFSQSHDLVVLQCVLELTVKPLEQIQSLMHENIQSRKKKQPLEYASAGSTFLRPEGRFVGQLTEEIGLKGYTVGGAQLSEKHGGFVINRGGATASDIIAVIKHIRSVIYFKYGIELECEVKIIGNDPYTTERN